MVKQSDLHSILIINNDNRKDNVVLENQIYSVGRHRTNSISIKNSLISRYHCTVLPVKHKSNSEQQAYWIIDGDLKGNRSTNGIFVNGQKCLSHELKTGDKISFGVKNVFVTYNVINKNDLDKITDSEYYGEYNDDQDKIRENNSENLLVFDEDKDTLVSEEQKAIAFIEEILLSLYQENVDLSYGIFEIDLEENVTYYNNFFGKEFQGISVEIEPNEVINDLVKEVKKSQQKIYVRQIQYQDKIFNQYAHYISNKTRIKSYLFEYNQKEKVVTSLRHSEEKYRAIVKQISEGIILIDPISKQIIEANSAYCEIVGYDSQEILNLTLYDLVPIDVEIIDNIIQTIYEQRLNLVQESIHRRQDGSLVNVDVNIGVITSSTGEMICLAVRDVTERKKSQEMLNYHHHYDLLTELPNRNLLNQQLKKTLDNAELYKHQFAVIFIDLDRFKNINDTLGHDIGDKFLQKVAHRLKNCIRSPDFIARWGGDEFTILLSEINSANDVAIVAQRIFASFKKPIKIMEYQLYASLSMGIAIYPQDGNSSDILLKNADIALSQMKKQGKDGYQYYNSIMHHKKVELLRIESLLYNALNRQEFKVYYQPLINLKTAKITGMEALIRWYNPQLGNISPAQFIPIAEETGLINSIGEWVLFTACRQNKIWQEAGYSPLTISVNLSAIQFRQKKLIQIIEKTLKETNLEPKYLNLEVTETSLIKNTDVAIKKIEELNNLKVSVSLDDFGTGYSSLGYLKKFSFDKIKIDQCFVRELTDLLRGGLLIKTLIPQ
jgi:diguanylate cyclase (GGDEF)-like protein/PAS domain S-box-containing protein